MDNSKWGAQRGWNRISVKREIPGESFDNEYEMQEAWEPLVKQVKQEQSPMDTEIGNVHEGQFAPNTAVKYEAEEWGRDSDSGIVEECPSEGTSEEVREDDDSQLEEIQSFISSKLLKEEESELESDSGISDECAAQASTQPGHVQSPHETFLEEEIMWRFSEDSYGTCDPLSTEEDRQPEMPLEVAIKEEQPDSGDEAERGHQFEDLLTKRGKLPPPYWGPRVLSVRAPEDRLPSGHTDLYAVGPPPNSYAAPCPADPPPEGYAAPPPPPDYWDARPHRLPKTYHCPLCVRWFTSVPHLRRHYNTALHKRLSVEKGQPAVPYCKKSRRSRAAFLKTLQASGDGGNSRDDTGEGGRKPPELGACAPALPLPGAQRLLQPPPQPQPQGPPPPPPPPPKVPPPSLPSGIRNTSRAQVGPPTLQQPQLMPDGGRAPAYMPQPFCSYEYEWQRHDVPRLFGSQCCQPPWVPDGPQDSLAFQMRWDMIHSQQQQQYLYQHRVYEQQKIRHRIQQEEQHDLCLKHLQQQQQQLVHPRRSGDSSQSLSVPTTSVTSSAVTVTPDSSGTGGTARKTVSSFPPDDTPFRNGRQNAYRIVPQMVCERNLRDSVSRTRPQSGMPQSMPVTAGQCRGEAVLLPRHIEKLQSQYPGITICAAESKRSPPPTPSVTATVASPDGSPELARVCPVCGVSFDNDTTLRRHVVISHSGGTFLECELCGAVLPDLTTYRAHLLEHGAGADAGKRHSCDECPKRFTNRAHLARHKMLHSGERPYVCHVCSKGFIRKDHMLKHAKVHDCRCAFCVPGAMYDSA